jgi:hypothetical protein
MLTCLLSINYIGLAVADLTIYDSPFTGNRSSSMSVELMVVVAVGGSNNNIITK